MRTFISSALQIIFAITLTGSMAYAMKPPIVPPNINSETQPHTVLVEQPQQAPESVPEPPVEPLQPGIVPEPPKVETPPPAAPVEPEPVAVPTVVGASEVKSIATQAAAARGWTGQQMICLVTLWGNESSWEAGRLNTSSKATGIPQALPGEKIYGENFSKMATVWRNGKWYLANPNPALEINWGLGYIADRYGTPCAAVEFWMAQEPHWY